VHAGASTELFIVQWARGKGSSPGRVEGSSRAMLATARPSCFYVSDDIVYGGVINNCHGPNEQHAKSINQSVKVMVGWIGNIESLV